MPFPSSKARLFAGANRRNSISGFTITHNVLSLDYCLRESVQAMLDVCDEVVVAELESDDGTYDLLNEWTEREPRLRIVNLPWPKPFNEPRWLTKIANETRKHLKYDWQFWASPDEVVSPESGPIMRTARTPLWCKRLNFFRDSKTLFPTGAAGAERVARFAKTDMHITDDDSYPEGEPPSRRLARQSEVTLFHYGFLRKQEAMIAKTRLTQPMFLGIHDGRIDLAERSEGRWEKHFEFSVPLGRYDGPHPKVAHAWLKERGYTP